MAKKLKITLLPNGEIQMETQGIKGKKCLGYIDVLLKLANAKLIDKKLTKEYYEADDEVYIEKKAEINLE